MAKEQVRSRGFLESAVGLIVKGGIVFGSALSMDAVQTSIEAQTDPPKALLGMFLGLHAIASIIHFDTASQNSTDLFVKSVATVNELLNGIASSKAAEKMRIAIKSIGIASIIALPYALNILASHPEALKDHSVAIIITKLALGLGVATTVFDISKISAKIREKQVYKAQADYDSQPETAKYTSPPPIDQNDLIPIPYNPELFPHLMPSTSYAERAKASNAAAVAAHSDKSCKTDLEPEADKLP